MNTFENLQKSMEAALEMRHQRERREVQAAIETLRKFFQDSPPSQTSNGVPSDVTATTTWADKTFVGSLIGSAPTATTTQSKRKLVINYIKGVHASAHDIVAHTGLTMKQVRGVLNAPGLGKRIVRRTLNGVTLYNFPGDKALQPIQDENVGDDRDDQ
jgi:hypothetical protein